MLYQPDIKLTTRSPSGTVEYQMVSYSREPIKGHLREPIIKNSSQPIAKMIKDL